MLREQRAPPPLSLDPDTYSSQVFDPVFSRPSGIQSLETVAVGDGRCCGGLRRVQKASKVGGEHEASEASEGWCTGEVRWASAARR